MKASEFLKELNAGAIIARKAGFANMYLTKEETEAAFSELEKFCDEAVGKLGMQSEEIKELLFWAVDTISWNE